MVTPQFFGPDKEDKVVFIDYDPETATLIKNQRFADFQLKIFKMFFNSLKDRGN